MKKKLTKADYESLVPYEREMECARNGYLRTPGRKGVAVFRAVYAHLSGSEYVGSDSCGHCELTLIKYVMESFFYTKELNEKKHSKTE